MQVHFDFKASSVRGAIYLHGLVSHLPIVWQPRWPLGQTHQDGFHVSFLVLLISWVRKAGLLSVRLGQQRLLSVHHSLFHFLSLPGTLTLLLPLQVYGLESCLVDCGDTCLS